MNSIAERAVAIGTALADHPDLPHRSLFIGSATCSIGMPGWRLEAVRQVATWASKFQTPIIISLSFSASGTVMTSVELAGVPVTVDATIGTAQAYELGRILQRELTRDVSIHIGADELLAAVDQVVAP